MYTKMKLFKSITMLSALFLTLAAAPAGVQKTHISNGATVTKIRVNGLSAIALLVDSETGMEGVVTASEDEIANTLALDFGYTTAHPTDPNLVIVFQGAGEIPNTALTSTSTFAHLALTTPTSFVVNRCILNLRDGEFACTPTDSITFDLTWVGDKISTFFEKINRHENFGPFTTNFHAEYSQVSAIVNGTFGEQTAADQAGFITDTQNKTFIREITVKANP